LCKQHLKLHCKTYNKQDWFWQHYYKCTKREKLGKCLKKIILKPPSRVENS
jgi:hypothetical protein